MELVFYAYRDFTAEPDAILADYGFGRAHHRVVAELFKRLTETVRLLAIVPTGLNPGWRKLLGKIFSPGNNQQEERS